MIPYYTDIRGHCRKHDVRFVWKGDSRLMRAFGWLLGLTGNDRFMAAQWTTMGGHKVYHAGDTGLFLDMQLIAEMNGPLDVALLPIGDNFTMGIDDAVKASEFLSAAMTIPMHYNTFPVIEADPSEFVAKVKDAGRNAVVVAPGSHFEL